MKKSNRLFILLSFILSFSSLSLLAQEFDKELLKIQQEWAIVNYNLKGDEQEKAFVELHSTITQFVETHPHKAESWVWQGIIQSSYAGAKGGLGALSYAKDAKISLEKAMEIDAEALDGSAYTSLGTLYHNVPGWPIGFGNDDKAKIYFEKALALNPDGIDPNYFYSEFLYDEREYSKAKQYLELAKNAPLRVNRPLADKSRQEEIDKLLAKVDKKIKTKQNKKRR